jgi:hypothetical protein
LTDIAYSPGDIATLGSGNLLTLDLSGTISTFQFDPAQSFSGDYFALETNSQNQVVIVDPTITTEPNKMSFLYPTLSTNNGPDYSTGTRLPDLSEIAGNQKFAAGLFSSIASLNIETPFNPYTLSSHLHASGFQDLLKTSQQYSANTPLFVHTG